MTVPPPVDNHHLRSGQVKVSCIFCLSGAPGLITPLLIPLKTQVFQVSSVFSHILGAWDFYSFLENSAMH